MKIARKRNSSVRQSKICVISNCQDDWGGCDDLWSKSVPYLKEEGYAVSVIRKHINRKHPEFLKLANIGVELVEFNPFQSYFSRIVRKCGRIAGKLLKDLIPFNHPFRKWLISNSPHLVVVNQSINFDALDYAYICAELNVPYIIVSHKAVDFYWPADNDRKYMKEAFKRALHCFFVSEHNLSMTEEQFGIRLSNSSVIFNPVKISGIVPYSQTVNEFRLACVGRLFLLDKGQDILLRIMARDKWRNRNIRISFIGKGCDENGLKEMATLLNVGNVEFKGQVNDFRAICKEHHAFILPSRSEGLPLVIVEAMTAGRMVIASKAGGNPEVIKDGITGYLGHANEEGFENAMERAWQNRHNWEFMGIAAAHYISDNIPDCPEFEFSKRIIAFNVNGC